MSGLGDGQVLDFALTSNLSEVAEKDDDAWLTDEQALERIEHDYPVPITWRVLILPMRPKTVSAGGIHIVSQVQSAQKILNYCGKIVAMGELCFTNRRFWTREQSWWERFIGKRPPLCDRPKVGDYVIYGRYAGQPILHNGIALITINEDEILDIVRDHEKLTIYV